MINHVEIEIIGKNPNYFLKEMIKRNINIYHLEKDKNILIVRIEEKDYKQLIQMKTTYKIKLIKKYGIGAVQNTIKKYYILFVFILLGIISYQVFSNMIFQIEMIHPNQELVKTIKKDLKELGIAPYHWKVTYQQKEKIKNKILEKEKDHLEWIEIEEIGTKIKVSMEERKKNSENTCYPRNIVAKKNATILEETISEGEILKRKQDYVEQGEIVVSGIIYNKEEIVSKQCATGKVWGEVWYLGKVTVSKQNTVKTPTKEKKILFFIQLFEKEWILGKKYKYYEEIEYNLLESKMIPIKVGFRLEQKTKIQQNKRTSAEIEEIAYQTMTKELQKKLQSGERILEKKVLKKSEKNSKIEVDILMSVKEDITSYEDISNIDIEKMKKEE